MVDISSQNNKVNITVSSSGNTANTNVTPDYAQYYSEKSKEWAISNKIVDNTDYSSKYYANESKKQADISTAKTTEVIESSNTAVSNIESARNNAIMDVNTAGATQVALATEQATIATNKASEVVTSGNEALANIDTAKNNAITSITNQETTSKNVLIDEGVTQVGLIQNEGATQVANVQSTGFYMRDDKLYYINSQGEEEEFKSGGSGLEVCDIGMALYVDETKGLRRYLNGQIVDINTNTQKFLDRLKQITTLYPSLLCTEDEWQSVKTLSAFGQVGKFVFNYSGDEVVSVRLPRVVNVQGLFDLQNLGMTVTESLPNIWYSNGGLTSDPDIDGALTAKSKWNVEQNESRSSTRYIQNYSFSASTCSSTYQDNAPVQQEAIQYPYFIQIATGQETEANITNKFENTNPQTLLESKYSDKPLYNESWLLSNGQYNLKATYPTAYEGLQVEYNTEIEVGTTVTLPSGVSYTKRGLSVKLSTEEYTDYDFVLNTADETFRLPLKTKLASGNAVVGNGMTLGLNDGRIDFGMDISSNGGLSGSGGSLGLPVGSNIPSGTPITYNVTAGVTTDPTKSGIETSDNGLYLYFYVGDMDQNHGIVNMGRIGEQLATKTDMLQASGAGMPSNKYIDLTLGASGTTYTAPANGWFFLRKFTSASNQFIGLYQTNNTGVSSEVTNSLANFDSSIFIPVRKGQVVSCYYSFGGETKEFRFIYAEGSN